LENQVASAFETQLEQTTQSLRTANEAGRSGITEDAAKLANDANHFFLFQLNAQIMLNTYIYHRLPPKFDVHVTVHRYKFLIIKPTRCTNFSNLFLK